MEGSLVSMRGQAEIALGFLKETEISFRRALGIQEKALGPDHPNVATVPFLLKNQTISSAPAPLPPNVSRLRALDRARPRSAPDARISGHYQRHPPLRAVSGPRFGRRQTRSYSDARDQAWYHRSNQGFFPACRQTGRPRQTHCHQPVRARQKLKLGFGHFPPHPRPLRRTS